MADDPNCRPCAICGNTRPELFKIWFDAYVKLFRCSDCGFVSQFPGPGQDTIITTYEDLYSLDFEREGKEFMYPERRRVLQDILKRVVSIKPKCRILDVGCGDGHFLALCSKQGLECFGVEDSKQLASHASAKSGAIIIQGHYAKQMFEESSFDVITLVQVLEHLTTPISVLEAARFHLRDEGLLVIEVPSIRSPHFLAFRSTGIKWFVKPPDGVIYSHFGYYSPRSIQTLTQRCGFRKFSMVTGRWQHKYSGLLRQFGKIVDPLFNLTKVGGILYIGKKAS